jgi:TRAP-type C4-dicarboxylate transport system permease small subunit
MIQCRFFFDLTGHWQGHLVDLLMATICLFMVTHGASLVKTTYFQAYPEFQYIRVGVAYSAIPIAGLITLMLRKFLIVGWAVPTKYR